ncbi:MAG: ABC transporter permease [Anaerolineales bacterium]|jgi:ABC-type lipoprotein release transport system permease subunit|nr:Lipoprotein-releasing system transmembrane protein LolE [Anaerolineales bacterium]GER79065.1 ABC transporter permease [Candidatus Denitrolinea symbiosum]MBW7919966.1 ABC transporter permease [Anaerolineales bacterium]MCZ2287836.1 ABC transporter permease [Anaerolineales bacterium]MCZ7547694.1 ABC transporter permease [Anaerolineales bacterium]
MINYFKMAYRNLGRHRRRTILSGLALAMGTALLMFIAAFFEGEMRSAMESTLHLSSGHLQVRDADYDPDKLSVAWDYLIENPDHLAAQIAALGPVETATPRLVASGIVTVKDDSAGVEILGVDPASSANDPYRIVEGQFVAADDREGILIGYPLAQSMGLKVGDQVNLLVNTSEGAVDEQLFTVRGIYSTSTTAYDKGIVLLPLAKAQAFSGAENRASMIFVLLKDREQADAVKAAIPSANFQVKTWRELNSLLVLVNDFSNAYLAVINLIILGVTATVIVNTLLMSVFERTREIGILSAIGMKGRQIVSLFLAEASLLALGGIAAGGLIGWALSLYFGKVGIFFGDLGMSADLLFEDRIFTFLTIDSALNTVITAFVITLLASLYPARMASRMEPVEALRKAQ